MTDGLLDTNILIDISRGYQPALSWGSANRHLILAIPSLVHMEMVFGAINKADKRRILHLLEPFPVIFPTENDAKWAMEQFEYFALSHQIEMIDCFIGALSTRLELPIFTRNRRDFDLLPDVSVVVPY